MHLELYVKVRQNWMNRPQDLAAGTGCQKGGIAVTRICSKGFVMASFYRDRDRIAHLTPDHGLISASARGACSVKSNCALLANLFSSVIMNFTTIKNVSMSTREVIEAF